MSNLQTEHVMLDLETFNTTPNSAILAIAGIYFDIMTGKTGKGIHIVIDEDSCKKAGLSFGEKTMEWWRNQDEDVKNFYKNHKKIELSKALDYFTLFLGKNPGKIKVWGNGSNFDNVILSNAYIATNKEIPWNFWNDRDVRTLYQIGLTFGFDAKKSVEFKGDKHNAIDDCKYQCEYVSKIFQLLHKI